MADSPDFPEHFERDLIAHAVTAVFRSAAACEPALAPGADVLTLLPDLPEPGEPGEGGPVIVAGMAGFHGEAAGLFTLHLELDFARLCAARLQGVPPESLGDAAINETVGRLTTRTASEFAHGLTRAGYECEASAASILRGGNFSMEPLSHAERHWHHFDCGEHRLVADVMIRWLA